MHYKVIVRSPLGGGHLAAFKAGVHVKAVLTSLNTAFLPIDPFHVRENVSKLEDKTKEI